MLLWLTILWLGNAKIAINMFLVSNCLFVVEEVVVHRLSCPPSSLVSPKKLVGCSVGSRYVEGDSKILMQHFVLCNLVICV